MGSDNELYRREAVIGAEARKSIRRWIDTGFLEKFFGGKQILDIGYRGYLEDVEPILPHAIGVDLDYPGYDGRTLPFATESQDTVFASHTLEHISDYRNAIADWFRVLKVGGFLVLAVPHQFLYERRLQLPSLWNQDHRRFYTPASLMMEIEEALDSYTYRVRILEDNDREFDYSIPPTLHAVGAYEILLVIEKISRPAWADDAAATIPSYEQVKLMDGIPAPAAHEKLPLLLFSGTNYTVATIVIVKLDHRGDFILSTRASEIIRAGFPNARITYVCGPWNAGSATASGLFDEVLPFAFFGEDAAVDINNATQASLLEDFSELLESRSFDLAVDLRIEEDTRPLLNRIDAKLRAGFGSQEKLSYLDIAWPLYSSTREEMPRDWKLGADRFKLNCGELNGGAITIRKGSEYPAHSVIIFGPYIDIPAGAYFAQLDIHVSGAESGFKYDLCVDVGSHVLADGPIEEGKVGFEFVLTEPARALEIRIYNGWSTSLPEVNFRGCRIVRQPTKIGFHQREAMALLAYLVVERVSAPYEIEMDIKP